MLRPRRMGDWTQKLREARPKGETAAAESAEDDDQGHMSAAGVGRARAMADAGVDEGTERWVSSVSISDEHDGKVTVAITIDLGSATIPPGMDAELKVAGGDVIPGTRFRIAFARGTCSATLEVGAEAAHIVQAHAMGKLVAQFEKWPSQTDRPSRTRESPRR